MRLLGFNLSHGDSLLFQKGVTFVCTSGHARTGHWPVERMPAVMRRAYLSERSGVLSDFLSSLEY